MSNEQELPIVYGCGTLKDARRKAEAFIHLLRDNKMSFKGVLKNPIEIQVGFHHIYFVPYETFRKWCKGRTYIDGNSGTVCHSGYPVGKSKDELYKKSREFLTKLNSVVASEKQNNDN